MQRTPDPASLRQLLQQIRGLLACHLALGLNHYPATPELRRFAATRTAVAPQQVRQEQPVPAQQPARVAVAQHEPVSHLNELTQQLAGCQRCSLVSTPVLGLGKISPRLLVVGDCFLGSTPPMEKLIWGRDEDALFWRMMAAIQLNQDALYVTNLIKCGQQTLPQANAARQGCLFWLEQELRLCQPLLICAMGEMAAQVLIGSIAPLLRLRGKFHPCCLPVAPQARVVATYHPRFLLQQPELKGAAWEDLKMLQGRLR
ncbi:uracil-DNA glycosylase [Candidatus Electronema sp. PJ]|uniref:uracil-DNA glycosylase n=1 Tax=Candidatus Electronema sp. PJ TaxID=3401572 RepID=UPI003AA7EFC0